MADAGCEYVVMEVSSQGLEQERLGPCEFETAVFTNLTQDHLDVHGTMEQYYQAKKKLFSMCKTAVVNVDDVYGRRLFSEITCPKCAVSMTGEAADFSAKQIHTHSAGVDYLFCDGRTEYPVRFGMPGLFNVANSADVLAVLDCCGFDMSRCTAALAQEKGVRGRAEILPTGRDFTVICDYAHTPDALENILSALKPAVKGRLICLFGCGGNRDAKKRPLMAAASAKYADFLIVTSDNPRDEDPDAIIEEVLTGLAGSQVPFIRITDRIAAIQWAVLHAQAGDVIVLAGKGHEDYQILAGGVKIHLDEREEVQKALALLEQQETSEKKD